MVQYVIGNKNVSFATNLRVAFKLKEITKAKTLQETMAGISKLDMDGQLRLLYASYKAVSENEDITFEAFQDMICDNLGIYAIADIINVIADGLLYSGLDESAKEVKKKQTEDLLAGANSSVKRSE